MSLHAVTSKEAKAALVVQKRNSTISSLVIAILSLILIGLILFIISITIEQKKTVDLVPFATNILTEEVIEKPEVQTQVERKPSAPSSNLARTIVSNSTSSISIPKIDIDIADVSLDFGNGDDFGFGDGGSDFGFGDDGSGAGGFGSGKKIKGTLGGIFYDFKQKRDGSPNKSYTPGKDSDYIRAAEKFQKSRFSAKGLKSYYQAKKQLFVRYIAIPFTPADAAPKLFNVENEVKPSSWLVHYKGKLVSPKSGRFRFVGKGDDYLSVAINSKGQIVAPWNNLLTPLARNNVNARKQPGHKSPFEGQPLIYGRWFTLKKGQEFDVSVAIGEHPGAMVGFLLMIEEDGKEYRKGSDGRPILPPFVFGPLADEDMDTLRKFPNWEFELNDVPVFNAIE